MASRPLPSIGNPVPTPRHFSKTFFSASRSTRNPSSCGSKRILSPGLTPRDLRISTGTVIWPLLVTLARKNGAGAVLAVADMAKDSLPSPEYSLLFLLNREQPAKAESAIAGDRTAAQSARQSRWPQPGPGQAAHRAA